LVLLRIKRSYVFLTYLQAEPVWAKIIATDD
jgi:hypothetical protein